MEELDDIRPEFGEHSKKNPFGVPEGYFADFSERLHKRMGVLEEPGSKMAGRKILRPVLAYITGFCLLIIIGIAIIITFHHPPQLKAENNFASLIQYSLENIDEQTIIEALPKNDKDPDSPEITKEEVIKYIQEQNIDLNSINEEL